MPKSSAPPLFDPDSYSKITLNDLVVYSIFYLHKQGSRITSEDVISACFVLFPKRFSLKRYPQWPDSAVVSRRWSDCKSKGFLQGGAATGFKITAKGIKRAEKIGKSLGRLKASPATHSRIRSTLRTDAGKYVRSIERSEAYSRYKKNLEINEFDFRSLLLCTMESPPATLSRNIEQFKDYVNMYERKDLLTFLEFSEGRFAFLLNARSKPAEKKTERAKK